ncbi:heparan-alpha-glucosaminide N-acetyltransferase domain-containing protein [Aliiroseovarius sp. F20344]|uniref:DUF418 domain-containing protein n=1 Tax=Aliiroseovarius sp. F20344 TaxID=2926414 RepID=UPI001FF28617|nr:heparan-alpha-glucosaminide N-acetyltransferase domain-containing protein [Aliiroseovarius sp. F20344]MCK0142110.1 heparan-alpha-glucosaminide N-acetyltransferase domain-containing protein [Aliiroseovarius sp. F20344]
MKRLHGIDIARYFAFVGMVLVNFRIVAEVGADGSLPSLITNNLEGRAAALFVVLAGVGASLGRAAWHVTLRRAIFLFAIGMLNMLVFEADILHFYALYFIVAIGFMARPNRWLLFGIAGFILIATAAQLFLDFDRGWSWDTLTYSGFWTVEGFLRHSFYNGWHPVFPWAAFLLWGMWLGRLSLGRSRVQVGLILGGALVAVAAHMASAVLIHDPEIGALMTTEPVPAGPLYMLAGGATATAVLGAVLMLTPVLLALPIVRRLCDAMIVAGRQTLTHYVAHILIGMGTLEAMGLLRGTLQPAQVFWISIAYCAIAALFSWLWSHKFKRGPLEATMRLITEGKT